MATLFTTPDPDLEHRQVIVEVRAFRASLADFLRVPSVGTAYFAARRRPERSSTIEGHTISDEDAAAVDDEPPLSADEATWLEILAYRRV